ncbi:MAG: GNAT family N-acetyltransferase [Chloroflexi bacterium]|nr:MAG: GNAT family N-acetyltransferase [Chloroflexota bacterium]MBL1193488.1 GNAT family N-acetyltransferase [Chloroflexota bacterium]NOH10779.1 GNAT family N-acetyltransferase [Chloroflexota bacterium]
MSIAIRILDKPGEIEAVEDLQLQIWPGSEIDVVPMHMLLTVAQNGGLLLGAYDEDKLVGFVYGFLAMGEHEGKPQIKHCSHQLGVLPEYRGANIGFQLKRAQWQMVRKQGIDWITWTYDPLLSTNAKLNIAKLGAICDIYKREVYGDMRDGLNAGLPSDRFQVDWWLVSTRVNQHLSKKPRLQLDLAHYLDAEAQKVNHTDLDGGNWATPQKDILQLPNDPAEHPALLLVEIPADFQALRAAERELAYTWRIHTRKIFEDLFAIKYLVTDFVYLPGTNPRSYYVLSKGDVTLGG